MRGLGYVFAFLVASCADNRTAENSDGGIAEDLAPTADAPEAPPEPTVLGVSLLEPNHGPFSGGTLVVVRGTELESYAEVYLDGHLADPTTQIWIDPTRLQIVTPPGNPGRVDVEVVVGDTRVLKKDAFTYDAFMVDPNRGSTVGGTQVNVTGQSTDFDADTVVTVDGNPLRELTVTSATQMSGRMPPGSEGFADIAIETGAGARYDAAGAFEYFAAVDPLGGGLGGGRLVDTLTITVVDLATTARVAGAYVIVGDDETTPFQGLTDDTGQIAFVGEFAPPISITATAISPSVCFTYGASTIDSFDASEAVVFLIPNPVFPPPKKCMGGAPGPGILAADVRGVIQFGGATGFGTTDWPLVIEPGLGRYRCAHVDTTRYNHFVANPDPGAEAWIIYDGESGKTAWEFDLYPARPGTMAVYAIAGHCIDDDSGNPVMVSAQAMGIARGVVASPGEIVSADVIVDIPLNKNLEVEWVSPPPIGWPGPDTYTLDVMLDLGGDGVLWRSDSRRTLEPGALAISLPAQAELAGSALYDASYLFVAAAATTMYGGLATPVDGYNSVGNPFSVVVKRGVSDIDAAVTIDGFLGIPTPVNPTNAGTVTNFHMEWSNPGAPSSLNEVMLLDGTGALAWFLVSEGRMTQYDLPNLTIAGGFDPLPPQYLTWIIWQIHKPAYDFNLFTYTDIMRESLFDAYSADALLAYWP